MNQNLKSIIDQYKSDKESVYNTWFINNEERLKAFRSIRRGVMQVIDVLWFQKSTNNIIGAFEVEKSTSIYSGILRLTDLAYSIATGEEAFYIIIPDNREKDLRMQLSRPSIKSIKVPINYILFSDLRQNCDALCKFGESHHIIKKIAKTV